MDRHLAKIAQDSVAAMQDGSLAFPQIVGRLIEAGFEGYTVDYRLNGVTFYLPNGAGVVVETTPAEGAVAAAFDADGIAAQVRAAQANEPGYTYKGFSRNVKACGCAGYIVSFPGRRVLYFGRSAETHVEHFPS